MASQGLLKAVSAGRPRQVRLLLESGVSTEDVDDCGQTSLIRAIFVEQDKIRLKILKILLEKGAIVSKADVVGRNALSWACIYGRENDVSILLKNADVDLDLNKCDINCHTALFHAVSSGNAAIVKMLVEALLKYDLSVDVADLNGTTPLMKAVQLGHDICASILFHYGKAKVGLGSRYSGDFLGNEKWAIQSLRDRGRVNPRKSKFPPILNQTTANRIQYRENRANLHRAGTPPKADSDGDSSFESDESSSYVEEFGSETSSSSSASVSVKSFYGENPFCRMSSPMMTVSQTSSTMGTASSDDEVDSFSTPLRESKVFRPTKDLPQLYGVYEDQHSPSYRPSAAKAIRTLVKEDNVTSVTDDNSDSSLNRKEDRAKASNVADAKTWTQLKKVLSLKKKHVYFQDTIIESDDNGNILSAMSESGCRSPATAKTTALPVIPEKVHLVQSNTSTPREKIDKFNENLFFSKNKSENGQR